MASVIPVLKYSIVSSVCIGDELVSQETNLCQDLSLNCLSSPQQHCPHFPSPRFLRGHFPGVQADTKEAPGKSVGRNRAYWTSKSLESARYSFQVQAYHQLAG